MDPQLVRFAFAIGAVVVGTMVARAGMTTALRLGIGYFRPYRGDEWPHGVQEDDDARFSWRRPSPRGASRSVPLASVRGNVHLRSGR
jgi:hypothetical protein